MNAIHISPTRRGALALAALLLTAALAGPAAAEAGELEFSGVTSAVRLSDPSAFPLTSMPGVFSPGIRVGYAVTDLVDVVVGYQGLVGMRHERSDGIIFTTTMHGLVAGARARVPILSDWLYAWVQVELEANLAVLEVDLAGRTGSQDTWSFGAVPQAGLEVAARLGERLMIVSRLGAGYALRLAHDFDAVRIDGGGGASRPLDLGAASFGGFVLTGSVGLRF